MNQYEKESNNWSLIFILSALLLTAISTLKEGFPGLNLPDWWLLYVPYLPFVLILLFAQLFSKARPAILFIGSFLFSFIPIMLLVKFFLLDYHPKSALIFLFNTIFQIFIFIVFLIIIIIDNMLSNRKSSKMNEQR